MLRVDPARAAGPPCQDAGPGSPAPAFISGSRGVDFDRNFAHSEVAVSVLMIRLGGLGDLLVALPSMACLRRALPGFRLALLCRGEYGGVFLDAGIADRIIPLEGREASLLFGKAGDAGADRERDFSRAVGWMQKASSTAIEGSLRSLGIPAVFFSPAGSADPRIPSAGTFLRRPWPRFATRTGPFPISANAPGSVQKGEE